MPVPSGEQRYYDGMLYLMSLMHASGNFRIIEKPATR
jgi:oligosaccharide reducing-end xylanase